MKRAVALILLVIFSLGSVSAMAADDTMVSTADFTYKTFERVEGRVKISFDVNANTVSDGIIGIASADIVPKDYADYSICFRIRTGGFFDANNGGSFSKVETVSYVKGETYRVEIDADITNKIYNAFVCIDGEKKVVAQNYAFRKGADSLGKITVRGGGGVAAGLYYIENILVEKGEGSFETFTLPNFFGENMVLQRGVAHKIFGRGTGEIKVRLEKGELFSEAAVTAENGEFEALLDPLPASLDAYTLTVTAKDKEEVIENVFIGDVYMLAGQSNMAQTYEHQTTEQMGGGVTTGNIPKLITDDRVKFFKLSQTASDYETFDVPFETNGWQPLNDSTKKKMSYIGMYFAKERLSEEPNVPIGFMSVAWRGTTVNRWTRVSDDNKTLNFTPTSGNIYNNHVAPFVGYPMCAILWYQGESDAKNPVMYKEAFKRMIEDWRGLWNDEDLPFLFVQLARYSKENYAPQREAQMGALEIENTGMSVILDTDKGTYNNIHPLGKEIVAQRLHLLAKKYVYGEDLVCTGPIFEKAEIENNTIKVYFEKESIGDGLCIKNPYVEKTNLCEFEISDGKGDFVKADAVINPDNTISVWAEGVTEPKFVRYAYSAVPENPNLFNKNGLPASPFNTDTRIFSTASFMSRGISKEGGNVQRIDFAVTPVKDNINGVMGFTAVENSVTAWNSCGIVIRFHKDGFFEYIDGSSFVRSSLRYEKGKTYKVTVIADFTDKTYSLTVDGEVLCIKANFRTGSLNMSNAGRFMIRGGDGESGGEFFFEDTELKVPEENSVIESESVQFIVSPIVRVYGAIYDENTLINAEVIKPTEGVGVMNIKPDRIFFWDDAMMPIK